MDLSFTPEEESFRSTVRQWLDENLPPELRNRAGTPSREERVAWYRRLSERGWLCSGWPEAYGGPGWSLAQQYLFHQELALQGAPQFDQGVRMVGPVLIEFGSEEQKQRVLPPIRRGEDLWCQGYSEPSAGSDLASLQLRAERRGDRYVVNGQKIWTSLANHANMIFLLARTDPGAEKRQAGITFFVSRRDAPGIEIRPIRQLTDEQHFFETFFRDVEIPVANRIGEENGGWEIGKRLLSHERLAAGGALGVRKSLRRLTDLAQREVFGSRPIDDGAVRQRLAQLHIEVDALAALELRSMTRLLRGEPPGPEASVNKLFGSELGQRLTDLAVEIQGPLAQLWDDTHLGELEGGWPKAAAQSRAPTIYGGTSEIQRNVIADRILGLPRN